MWLEAAIGMFAALGLWIANLGHGRTRLAMNLGFGRIPLRCALRSARWV